MSGKTLNSYWREIVGIIEGGLKPDPQRVSTFADHMAQRLEDDGEKRLAERIRQLTVQASKPAGSTFELQALPADVEAHQNLVEQILPVGPPEYPVLPSHTSIEIRRFVELNQRAGELAACGVEPPSSLLLYGPPGCGKTMAAIAIALDLQMTLFVVRLDSLLGSYLGNSAKNLRRVFDNAIARPTVLFLDEFDSIGKMRDDAQEVGEIKRLVSSLLQNLDRVQGSQIVIAATNHHHLLDSAIWRRFDVALHIGKPETDQLREILHNLVPADRLSRLDEEALAILTRRLSGADVTGVVKRALQDEFLYPDIPLVSRITSGILRCLDGVGSHSNEVKTKKHLVDEIYRKAEGDLNVGQIARLAGCSRAYAHEIIKSR